MKKIPLEDNVGDVLSKAQKGLGITDDSLAQQAKTTLQRIHQLKNGDFVDEPLLLTLSEILGLRGSALLALAHKTWVAPEVQVLGLDCLNTPFRDMTVNSYLITDLPSGQAALFDTGTDSLPVLKLLAEKRRRLVAIFLTHTHGDHILEMDLLHEKTGAPVYVQDLEPIARATTFHAGHDFAVGSLKIETRSTFGHSKGGTTYLIRGLERLVAVVGDALFAGSMGGGSYSYPEALRTNREQILSLPPETVLCPGHGPLTTVAKELQDNPFFP